MHAWLADVAAVVAILASVGILGYLRQIARLVSVFTDFPPHRHVFGQIIYPKGFSPENSQGEAARR